MGGSIEIKISGVDEKTLNSIIQSLQPEIESIPGACKAEIKILQGVLQITLSCDRIGLLRAIANSILSTIAMLIELKVAIES
ncbi:KEOPS complex subunit Pcc1 [Thermogladius sp. 4427co]|uniref:KEOPS complex subunit Pcc1 n=1 Tax=Thermogladius sp. 4427co TaxID=3450718 RepID=UPI003F7A3C92